jgi:hypothetical protein
VEGGPTKWPNLGAHADAGEKDLIVLSLGKLLPGLSLSLSLSRSLSLSLSPHSA